jgi:hypothetical protein
MERHSLVSTYVTSDQEDVVTNDEPFNSTALPKHTE